MKISVSFVACCLVLNCVASADESTYTFPGEPGRQGKRLLDLRYLNEEMAGESAFVRLSADGNDMLLGDGRPARFWGVSSGVCGEALPRTTRWVASLGVNLVRIRSSPAAAATLNPKHAGSHPTNVDPKAVEKAQRMVAELKKHGIYTMITPHWVAKGSDVTEWGIEGYTGMSGGTDGLWGLLFFNDKLQAPPCERLRQGVVEEATRTVPPPPRLEDRRLRTIRPAVRASLCTRRGKLPLLGMALLTFSARLLTRRDAPVLGSSTVA